MGTPVRTALTTERSRHVTLAPEPSSVGQGRRWFRETLSEIDHPLDQESVDAAVVALSEILTNAIGHTQSERCLIVLVWSASQLLFGVSDDEPHRKAKARRHEDDDQDGRGLFLVNELADGWGSRVLAGGGRKIVWARFNGSCRTSAVPGQVSAHR